MKKSRIYSQTDFLEENILGKKDPFKSFRENGVVVPLVPFLARSE